MYTVYAYVLVLVFFRAVTDVASEGSDLGHSRRLISLIGLVFGY